jgi:hypothetical protein
MILKVTSILEDKGGLGKNKIQYAPEEGGYCSLAVILSYPIGIASMDNCKKTCAGHHFKWKTMIREK